MSCTGGPNCLCGCCAGTSVQTPQVESNAPGLPAISYRAGTWATFKESMLARVSSSDYPALAALKTRSDDDFTIAFLDATAMVLDILTFYQECLANESYLRTAVQLRSLTELSRLICYQSAPGVSASVYVAFTLKTAPGQPPDPAAASITIPQGTQLQSVPAQGQKPQVFETSADIQAKAAWNAMPVETRVPWIPPGGNGLYLSGTSTQLQLGDSLLILGVAREEWSPPTFRFTELSGVFVEARAIFIDELFFFNPAPSDEWEVVVVNQIEVDTIRNLTYVAWDQPLSHESGTQTAAPWPAAKVFAFRQKAALFGHNAPNPNLFVNSSGNPTFPALVDTSGGAGAWVWNGFQIADSGHIDLDAAYPKIVVGSWFALTVGGMAQLYKATSAAAVSLSKFALSGKVTELAADYYADPNLGSSTSPFTLLQTEVWAQSDQLTVANQPLDYPLYGKLLDLANLQPDLVGAQVVALSGNPQKITVADGVTTLAFAPLDGSAPMPLKPGDILTITGSAPPLPLNADGSIPDWSSYAGTLTLNVQDSSGRPGTIANASLSNVELAPSGSSDPVVSEYALVASVSGVDAPYPHTQIVLQSNLQNCYDRNTTTVNANAGPATNGQSVSEILGSGSASTPDQSFTLKQAPLTFIQAPTPTGRQSTLQIQANGVAWTEVPTLYQQGPSQQVFTTLNQPGGTTEVVFGDGVEGATLPTGQNNIQANYRIGLGSAGNVAAGALTTLMDRPLGVSGVTNPEAATGGQDPDSVDDIRSNAPQTVLTLGRAVSITDYQSFAATFAGIVKAYAIWIPNGPGRGVFLTVAGVGGASLPPGNLTLANLVAALQNYGNPLIPITAVSFQQTLFGLSADLAYDPRYDPLAVQAQVRQTLAGAYSFEERDFGQAVSVDEVAAIIQNVPGVIAVNVIAVNVTGLSTPALSNATRICAFLPIASATSLPQPAEILMLNPDPTQVILGVMS
ncbi:MAG TPA: putative baseplate assembly protein [Bryobacteraceae bacterium]